MIKKKLARRSQEELSPLIVESGIWRALGLVMRGVLPSLCQKTPVVVLSAGEARREKHPQTRRNAWYIAESVLLIDPADECQLVVIPGKWVENESAMPPEWLVGQYQVITYPIRIRARVERNKRMLGRRRRSPVTTVLMGGYMLRKESACEPDEEDLALRAQVADNTMCFELSDLHNSAYPTLPPLTMEIAENALRDILNLAAYDYSLLSEDDQESQEPPALKLPKIPSPKDDKP